jgi:diguanylate cyclase (GGDEF)-like protein
MLCLLVGWVLFAILLTASWALEKKSAELGFWSAGFWLISFGCMLQALRMFLSEYIGSGFGIAFVFAGISLIWIGFRAFDGFTKPYYAAMIAPALWAVVYFGFSDVFLQPNNRIALYSVFVAAQVMLVIYSIWCGWIRERLPARLLIMAMLASFVFISLVRVPISIFYPVHEVNGVSQTLWFGVVSFILYVNGLGVAIGIFSLSSERSLRQYKHASETDMLTGVLNRRAFNERVSGALMSGGGIIALIDVDHFKNVNDSYGHAAGDVALCGFTQTIASQTSRHMVFGRTGGEEFTLFVPNLLGEEARHFCEKLCKTVALTPVSWRDRRISMTVSIGVCELTEPGQDLGVALLRADTALYAAKKQGRNRVVVWAPREADCSEPPVVAVQFVQELESVISPVLQTTETKRQA